MRWLTGKHGKLAEWSLVSSDLVLECAEAAFATIAKDGDAIFDPELDPFAQVALNHLLTYWSR